MRCSNPAFRLVIIWCNSYRWKQNYCLLFFTVSFRIVFSSRFWGWREKRICEKQTSGISHFISARNDKKGEPPSRILWESCWFKKPKRKVDTRWHQNPWCGHHRTHVQTAVHGCLRLRRWCGCAHAYGDLESVGWPVIMRKVVPRRISVWIYASLSWYRQQGVLTLKSLGFAATKRWLEILNLCIHPQVQQKGKLLTVFSSSHYCGGSNEAACILAHQNKLRTIRLDTTWLKQRNAQKRLYRGITQAVHKRLRYKYVILRLRHIQILLS